MKPTLLNHYHRTSVKKERIEPHIRLSPGLPTKASGSAALETDMGSKTGQTAQGMRESGRTTKPMALENSGTLMGTCLKVTGGMIRRMEGVPIHT
jgi:hypothetical protein